MALNLFSRYPGRANPASIDYPQGSFKNKTAPTATDGTLLEQDWANDTQGFLQSLLKYRDLVANGEVDKVGASQYFDALFTDPSETLRGMPLVATQAETNAGMNDGKVVTPKKLRLGFSFIRVPSAWAIVLPSWLGGFILQGGLQAGFSSYTVNFPVSYPNGTLGFPVVTCTGDASSQAAWAETAGHTNSQFTAYTYAPTSGGGAVLSPRGFTWISCGY